jgi:hypothetical protein
MLETSGDVRTWHQAVNRRTLSLRGRCYSCDSDSDRRAACLLYTQALSSAYVITLVGTTHQQLHTTGLERSTLIFLQGGTAVQLILTFTIQFLQPTVPKLLWQALALLVPIDVHRYVVVRCACLSPPLCSE